MAIIKHAQARTIAREAIVLDLGDLHRQGEALREKAEAQARHTIEQAKLEAERIIEEAMARGFEEGRAAGAEQGCAKGFETGRNEAFEEQFTRLQALITGWNQALEEFFSERDTLLRDARQDVVELAVRIAERVLKREIKHDPDAASRQLAAALQLVLNPTMLRIEVSKRDHAAISDALPSLLAELTQSAHTEIIEVAEIEPGGCRVRTGAGIIDAQIDTQLDRLVDELLSAGQSPRWENNAAPKDTTPTHDTDPPDAQEELGPDQQP